MSKDLKAIINNLMSTNQQQNIKENEDTKSEEVSEEVNENRESTEELDQLVEDQQERIRELEEEIERLQDGQLRKAAEMDNMRKRLQRERQQVYQASREAALEAFLPINDDLIRTLKAFKESDADPAYLDGVKMIANKFEDVLEKHGVERIDETGVPFDVDLHDALLRQKPEDDSVDSGIVLDVIENGYKIGDKTIRHAKVIVSE